MPFYVKKPTVIEAIRWKGPDHGGLEQLQALKPPVEPAETWNDNFAMYINTLEGKMLVKLGDWIVKGVEGEYYCVQDSIFRKLHTPANGKAAIHMVKYPGEDVKLADEPTILAHPMRDHFNDLDEAAAEEMKAAIEAHEAALKTLAEISEPVTT